jgi:Ni,Fe-hydrogenase III small subunit
MIKIIKASLTKGKVTKPIDCSSSSLPDIEKSGNELAKLIKKQFGRSLHIREVDTGSCGACESEIIACTNPIYDIQRFGIDFVASPRHADALLVTGPVSKNMEKALKSTYDAMPAPKFVISLGNCALDGGIFKGAYYVVGGVSKVVPVLCHIPGCPPKPYDIICALLSFLKDK